MYQRQILITGVRGTLGQAFTRVCAQRKLPYHGVTRQELDIAEPSAAAAVCVTYQPWAIINAAGYVRVDEAEADAAACYRANCTGPVTLAEVCRRQGVRLLTFSTDLVFDGAQRRPYIESVPVAPLNVYGRSKAEAEVGVQEICPDALIVRTSAFFGPWDRANFVTQTLSALTTGQPVVAADDTIVSPTYVPDLVAACLKLLQSGERGIWHLANDGTITWAALARRVADLAKLDPGPVEGRPVAALGLPARRPLYSALGTERGPGLPALDDALHRYFYQDSEWTR